jgi:hypothetical protein
MAYSPVVRDQQHFISQIEEAFYRGLEPDETEALRQVLNKIIRIPSPKILDLNIPFWLIRRFFIQIYFGEDKRTKSRNERDKYEKEKLREFRERDAEFYFMNLPDKIQYGFNYEEKRAIHDIFKRAIPIPSRKIIETNLSFKFKKKYYLTLYLGFDRRQGRRRNINTTMNKISFATSMLIYIIVISIVLYFGKSALNYDVVKGSHGYEYIIEKLGLNK